jgi:hypothetical protein
VTAAAPAASPPVCQESGGQNKQSRIRVEVAGTAVIERLGVGRKDLRAARVVEGKPGRVRLGQGAFRHPFDGTT